MTYLIGINQFNINAIICDAHVSWWRFNRKIKGENIGLKSGLFFRGCIFAISGSVNDARTFIIECKLYLTGHYTLPDLWKKFQEFVKSYPFTNTKDSDFQLLLSSRNNGKLQFYVLDSNKSSIEPRDNFTSLGSGKPVLDQYIQNRLSVNTGNIDKLVTIDKILPPSVFPHIYCLWLNEFSQGLDLTILEQHHVGGIFHFLWQDTQGEHAQYPAVYVLSAADPRKKIIYSWIYRVTYAQGALVVDNPIKNAREVMIDTASRPKLGLIPSDQMKLDITREIDSQPFYNFCGFGFTDPNYRGEFGIAFTNEGKYDVDKAGNLSPRVISLIQDKFSRDYKLSI